MELLREMPPRGLLPAASPKEVTELLRETLPRGLLPARGVPEGLLRGVLGPLRTTRTKETAPRAARCTHLQGHVLLSWSAFRAELRQAHSRHSQDCSTAGGCAERGPC